MAQCSASLQKRKQQQQQQQQKQQPFLVAMAGFQQFTMQLKMWLLVVQMLQQGRRISAAEECILALGLFQSARLACVSGILTSQDCPVSLA